MTLLKRSIAILIATAGFAVCAPANAQIVSEFGTRYWYSTGQTDFDLFTGTGPPIVSRLTYEGLHAHSFEIFGHIQNDAGTFGDGLFAKGYAGYGVIPGGTLIDEDFPPFVVPYSRTESSLDDGNFAYFSVDFGTIVVKRPRYQIGVFTGYHYWNEQLHAFGCTQTATSGICVPTIPESVAVISNNAVWHSWRLGVVGMAQLSDRVSLTGEAALIPITWLDNIDNHHLRPGINPLPIDGTGHGIQLEAMLNVMVTERFSVGVGGRYWRLGPADGFAHFEQTPGGGFPQVTKFNSERYGVFVQGSLSFP